MKGDFSRSTFDPQKHFSRVLMQQGRVQVDADWNEQGDIIAHRLETEARDVIGLSGVPKENAGFGIVIRKGLHFDGKDDYISIGSTESLSFTKGKPFTLEIWLNPRLGGAGGVLISRFDVRKDQQRHGEYLLLLNADATITFERLEVEIEEIVEVETDETDTEIVEFEDRKVSLLKLQTTDTIPFGEYSHIAVSCDNKAIKIYVNERLALLHERPKSAPSYKTPFLIGATLHEEKPAQFFDGIIDEVRIWREARTEQQLHNDMHRVLEGHVDHLESCWRFEEDSGDEVMDATQHGNDGKLGGGNEASKPERLPYKGWIGPGRCYVAGILCENEHHLDIEKQMDAPTVALPIEDSNRYLVYLDVWQRFISVNEDPSIREVALGGADTTARLQTLWQVKISPNAEAEELVNKPNRKGRMSAQRQTIDTLLENRLYRVEIHNSGRLYGDPSAQIPAHTVEQVIASQQQIKLKDVGGSWTLGQVVEFINPDKKPGFTAQVIAWQPPLLTLNALPPNAESQQSLQIREIATFKWSRDNGILVFPIESIQGTVVTLRDPTSNSALLNLGDWVEIVDDDNILANRTEPLCQVSAIDLNHPSYIKVTLNAPLGSTVGQDPSKHPLMRCWSQSLDGAKSGFQNGIELAESQSWLSLEHGIQVSFEAGGNYETGDFWWIPARAITQRIEWPTENDTALPQSPNGIDHAYASIALLWFDAGKLRVEDMRNIFTPMSSGAVSKTGDVMTGALTIRDSLYVSGDTVVGKLYGKLASAIVDSEQIIDHAITHSKLAENVGYVPPNYSILSASRDPYVGYSYTGSFVTSTHPKPTWTLFHEPLPEVSRVTAVTAHGKIYLLGDSGQLWEFDPERVHPLWERKADMLTPWRTEFGVGVVNNKIYVVGGLLSPNELTDRNEEYDPETDTWSAKAPMPTSRSHLAVTVTETNLYALGGLQDAFWGLFERQVTNVNEAYHPMSDTWHKEKSLPTGRYNFGAAALNGQIYIFGGERKWLLGLWGKRKIRDTFAYSLHENRWFRHWPMAMSRSSFAVVIVEDRIYIVGGKGLNEHRHGNEVFDANTGHWSISPPLNIPRSSAGACELDGTLYVFGGETEAGGTDTIEAFTMATLFYIHQKNH